MRIQSVGWLVTLILSILTFTVSFAVEEPTFFLAPYLQYIRFATGILGIIAAALGVQPKREVWTDERRTVEAAKKSIGDQQLNVLLLLMLGSPFLAGCHGPINIKTEPVAALAHYGKQVVDTCGSIQNAVIAAEAAKVPGVTVERVAPVVRVTVECGKKGQELANALTELDALPLGDLSRPTKIKAIGVILASMNALIFNMIVPVGDDPLLIRIRDLVREVSVLLLTVQQQLVPSPPAASALSDRVGLPRLVLGPARL